MSTQRPFQFRLRTLLLVALALSVPCAAFAWYSDQRSISGRRSAGWRTLSASGCRIESSDFDCILYRGQAFLDIPSRLVREAGELDSWFAIRRRLIRDQRADLIRFHRPLSDDDWKLVELFPEAEVRTTAGQCPPMET